MQKPIPWFFIEHGIAWDNMNIEGSEVLTGTTKFPAWVDKSICKGKSTISRLSDHLFFSSPVTERQYI